MSFYTKKPITTKYKGESVYEGKDGITVIFLNKHYYMYNGDYLIAALLDATFRLHYLRSFSKWALDVRTDALKELSKVQTIRDNAQFDIDEFSTIWGERP